MEKTTISEILGDFNTEGKMSSDLKGGKPITLWLPKEVKDRFDRIQQTSGRRFSKKLREIFITAIDLAEKKAA
jgi:hypothetical protein